VLRICSSDSDSARLGGVDLAVFLASWAIEEPFPFPSNKAADHRAGGCRTTPCDTQGNRH
jgi:hypothetical protein